MVKLGGCNIWRFPKIGVPLSYHFFGGTLIWGYHHLWKPKYDFMFLARLAHHMKQMYFSCFGHFCTAKAKLTGLRYGEMWAQDLLVDLVGPFENDFLPDSLESGGKNIATIHPTHSLVVVPYSMFSLMEKDRHSFWLHCGTSNSKLVGGYFGSLNSQNFPCIPFWVYLVQFPMGLS